MNEEILSRQILMALFCFHCLLSYWGSIKKINVPAKVYNMVFLTEVLLVTGYIIYTCITEPFYDGVPAAVFAYIALYVSIWFSYAALRHWTIVPGKLYDFYPEKIKEWGIDDNSVGGYITESKKKIFVYVDDDELCKTAKKDVPVKIKYREWKNFAAHFDVADLKI